MSKIEVSFVAGLVNVEDVQVGWEVRYKRTGRQVTLSQARSVTRQGGWCLHVTGRSTPLRFIKGSIVMVMAPVEGAEFPPFLPKVSTIKRDDMVFPVALHEDGGLRVTRPQAVLLADLLRVYLPDLEDESGQAFVLSLRSALTRFAESV